jgi:transposase InsO family protein
MKAQYPTRLLCEALEVSPSGFYAWQQRLTHPSPRNLENAQLALAIEQIYRDSRQTYGSPRVQHALVQSGRRYSRNRIARLMRAQRLYGRLRKRFRVQTTDSNHHQPIAPN